MLCCFQWLPLCGQGQSSDRLWVSLSPVQAPEYTGKETEEDRSLLLLQDRAGCLGSESGVGILGFSLPQPSPSTRAKETSGSCTLSFSLLGSALSTLQSSPHLRWIEGEIEAKMVGESAAQVGFEPGSNWDMLVLLCPHSTPEWWVRAGVRSSLGPPTLPRHSLCVLPGELRNSDFQVNDLGGSQS